MSINIFIVPIGMKERECEKFHNEYLLDMLGMQRKICPDLKHKSGIHLHAYYSE